MNSDDLRLVNLWNKSMLILGFDAEGYSTYKFLRELYPQHNLGIADKKLFEDLPSSIPADYTV